MTAVAEVVYIAGAPRSGTTILASLLGEVPGFFNAGELRFLWQQLSVHGECGCGYPVAECEVWAPILCRTLDLLNGTDAANLAAQAERHSLIRALPLQLVGRALARAGNGRDSLALRTVPIYGDIAEQFPGRLVVDSSKSPSYARLLGGSPDIRLHVLHLVRDPRAAVWSWLRERGRTLPPLRRAAGIAYRALKWTAWNLWVDLFLRSCAASRMRVLYEDLGEQPYEQLRSIVATYTGSVSTLPLAGRGARWAQLEVNHTIFGNGNRFRVGLVPVTTDDAWRMGMHRYERAIVVAATWPLLLRYGIRAGGRAQAACAGAIAGPPW